MASVEAGSFYRPARLGRSARPALPSNQEEELGRRQLLIALLASLTSIPGSGKSFVGGVEVALPTRFRVDSQERALVLRGNVTSRNIDRNTFDAIDRAVSDASAPPSVQAIIWTLDQGFDSPLAPFIAFDLSLPVSRNQSL